MRKGRDRMVGAFGGNLSFLMGPIALRLYGISLQSLLRSLRHGPKRGAWGIIPWVYSVGGDPRPADSWGKRSGIKEMGTSWAA